MTEQEKRACPLTQAPCTPKCAVYIQLQKPVMRNIDGNSFPDPEVFQYYEGCGVIQEIPWILAKREPQQLQEAPKK